jgi:hypothetical protein
MATTKSCKWHKRDEPLEEGVIPYCPNCSRMLDTRLCINCYEEFLDWESKSFDDVIVPPSSFGGDLMCQPCASRAEYEEERQIEEECLDYGFSDAY